MSKVAVAHKDYDVRGGGEILAEHLARGLDAPLVVGHGDESNQPVETELDIRELAPESRWHRLAARGGYHDIDGWLGRTATQAKRWLFEQELSTGADLWVANSDIVARRMRRYWGIDEADLRVVYPPVETAELSPDLEPTGDYYLSLGRLAETKRVGEAIRAANSRGLDLKIAGTGPRENHLQELAGPTVEMLGWVDGERKRELLAGAKAMISCCRNEDFGMAPVEAMASGTPVITVDEGMPQHTVADGERGITYNRGELEAAISRFETMGVEWSDAELAQWATAQFGVGRFVDEMQQAVAEARERTRVDPALSDRRREVVADD